MSFGDKIKGNPVVTAAAATWCGIVGYGLYNIKNRRTDIPLYLINLRLAGQGAFAGIILGLATYSIYKRSSEDEYYKGKLISKEMEKTDA